MPGVFKIFLLRGGLALWVCVVPSSTVENYLKAIWSLGQELGDAVLVPVGRVAERLGVTPGTVTTMMNQLERRGLVDYTPRKGVRLNESGRKAALGVLRRHRLVELFLVKVMKLDWSHVHEEAEVLEHVISDRLLERMDEMLGFPTHDPHGDPIPTEEGEVPREASISLADCLPGLYVLRRVKENDPEFLRWLMARELQPGVVFDLKAKDLQAGTMTLSVAEQDEVLLALPAAQNLLVAEVV